MEEFVVCINDKGAVDITEGRAYKVVSRRVSIVRVIDNVGESTAYHAYRFKTIEAENLDGWKTL